MHQKTCVWKIRGYCCVKICANLKRTRIISREDDQDHVCSACFWCSGAVGVYVCAPGNVSPGSRLVVVVVGVGEGGRPLVPEQSSPREAAWSPFRFL